MYFDTSADPALNELQTRRFIGHLHLIDIAAIFGDTQSLPADEACNNVAGPTMKDGLIWHVTVTPDLYGVNLVSVSLDGTVSSAFDLDGDRVVDLLDMHLGDNRRITFLTEQFGLDVFELWLLGRNPFCESELARELDLPSLGCNEKSGESSGGGGASAADAGIVNPMDLICSEYDTGARSQIMSRAPSRTTGISHYFEEVHGIGRGFRRNVETWVVRDAETGEHLNTRKLIVDSYWRGGANAIVQIIEERVEPDGSGHRESRRFDSSGQGQSFDENQCECVHIQ